MARKRPLADPSPANLSPQKMREAIPKLERRIAEFCDFDVGSIIDRIDPRIEALEKKMDGTMVDVFGHGTLEYRRYRVQSIDMAPMHFGESTSINEVRRGVTRGLDANIGTLRTAVQMLKERLADFQENPIGRNLRAFDAMRLHPELGTRVVTLFQDGHFSNAIEEACKVLDAMVRLRSGRDDLSGTALMQTVFSPNMPVLRFNESQSDSGRSEQQGMMYLFAGAMLALRNPRAHGTVLDDAESTIEILGFIDFLLKSLDRAK